MMPDKSLEELIKEKLIGMLGKGTTWECHVVRSCPYGLSCEDCVSGEVAAAIREAGYVKPTGNKPHAGAISEVYRELGAV